jgi:hypothetical protein
MEGCKAGTTKGALGKNHKRPSLPINSLSTSGITSFSTSASIHYKTTFITVKPCMSRANLKHFRTMIATCTPESVERAKPRHACHDAQARHLWTGVGARYRRVSIDRSCRRPGYSACRRDHSSGHQTREHLYHAARACKNPGFWFGKAFRRPSTRVRHSRTPPHRRPRWR